MTRGLFRRFTQKSFSAFTFMTKNHGLRFCFTLCFIDALWPGAATPGE
jgi:hypothetical protein